MPNDFASKLVDLSFIVIPAILFFAIFFYLERKKKSDQDRT